MSGIPGNMEGLPMMNFERVGSCPICGDIYTEARVYPDGSGRFIHKEVVKSKPFIHVYVGMSCTTKKIIEVMK